MTFPGYKKSIALMVSKDNSIGQRKETKEQCSTKHYTGNQRANKTNTAKYRGTQVFRK
jgi:hypothetical protein